MKRRAAFSLFAAVAALLIGPASSSAERREPRPITIKTPALGSAREIVFNSLPDLFPTGSTKLVNGELVVDLTAWSAVLVARLDSGSYCTATMVGPKVMLTAAHCIDAGFGDKGDTISGRVNIGGAQYALEGCEMHNRYATAERQQYDIPRSSEDYALCQLDAAVPGMVFETIAKSASLTKGSALLMTGYGCTKIGVVVNALEFSSADESGSERLRLGDGKIDAVDVADHTAAKGSYLRTRTAKAEPVICPGDSGGPALSGASLGHQDGSSRRVAGVNSMVTAIPVRGGYHYLSFIASMGTTSFMNFLEGWAKKNEVDRQVCGYQIKPGQKNCRA